jgi:hypothetical protein
MNKKTKRFAALLSGLLLGGYLTLPAAAADTSLEQYGMLPIYAVDVAEGEYTVAVDSDSAAFQGVRAVLTVSDGTMTAVVTPNDTDLSELFLGNSRQAAAADESIGKDLAGTFSIPVASLDRTIELAAFAETTQEWTDAAVLFRADSLPQTALAVELPDYDLIEAALDTEETGENMANTAPVEAVSVDLEDGEYSVSVDLEGGSGKASVVSPTILTVKDGKAYARITWSSSNYDYMIVGTETYWNTSAEDANSVFEIPIGCWDSAMPVIADTTAMGTPHEISYELTFYRDSIGSKGQLPQESAKRVVTVALGIILGGGILNHYVKKKRSV